MVYEDEYIVSYRH